MRTSIVIAARNEGESLARTVETCLSTTDGLEFELVVVDDASTDGSVEHVSERFPGIHTVHHERPLGPSPSKAAGAERAHGEVLVFLDGHTNPEGGAIVRLVEGIDRVEGQAILTPAVAALDVAGWRNDPAQIGHGYSFDLQQFECRWLSLAELRPTDGMPFYESPALIGCAFAIARDLYDRVWGFDAHMRSWGLEDLDLGLKAWLVGAQILHDPGAIVGHRFRTSFDNYHVPVEDVLVNQLRVARKHFTPSVWEEWLAGVRGSTEGQTDGHPEGVWARAWHLFEADRFSAEEERAYLQAQRVRDEFGYAQRFGLTWPTLHGAPGGEAAPAAGRPAAAATAAQPRFAARVQPSPSPAPCRFTINGPADVPGLAQYQYAINLPAGKTATNIQWHVDKPTATFQGATNQPTVTVAFAAGTADWITLTANFTLDGSPECASMQIALVRFQVGARTFGNPGLPNSTALMFSLMVDPPPPPAAPLWVTTHVPGSTAAAFTYNGPTEAPEPANRVDSHGAGGGAAFTATTTVKLTAPPQKPTALQNIEVGFMQAGVDAGTADFPGAAPAVRHRTVTVPTTTTIDWLSSPPSATDNWPWYDDTAKDRGTGSGTWARALSMSDSPQLDMPAQFNPNHPADPDATRGITAGHDTFAFQIRMGVRTLDTAMQANTLYFDHGRSTWAANYAWPVVPGTSIVAFPAGNWIVPSAPTRIPVNVVPTVRNHGVPFMRWVPAKYIDYTPDVTLDAFWQSHEVAIVRVTSLEGDPAEEAIIHTEVIRRLNSTTGGPEQSFSLREMWFSPDPEEREHVQAGDTLVLYIGPERPIVAQRITTPVEDSPLVQRLERIASLRLGEGGSDALREANLHPDPGVAQYALKRLIAHPEPEVSDAHLTQLRQVRDDEGNDSEVRLLAEDLILQREGRGPASDEAYQWLQTAITQSTATDWTQITPFVRKLVTIDARRAETVRFLVGLATDEQARETVRIAAYSGFESLVYDAPPPEAEEIIQACFQMLRSESSVIRRAGATLLYNFSVRGGPGPLEGLSERAAGAIRSAQEAEADDQVRFHLERVSEMLAGATGG
jgi:GT2 family glycosyltransferase